ncbi:MAG: FitA-like ribbon-helix-helix domain-containing protein [Dehalococcoidia bacterium]
MAEIVVRDLDERLVRAIEHLAECNGRTLDAEVSEILKRAATDMPLASSEGEVWAGERLPSRDKGQTAFIAATRAVRARIGHLGGPTGVDLVRMGRER